MDRNPDVESQKRYLGFRLQAIHFNTGFPAESPNQITLLTLVHEKLLMHLETTYARNQLGLILLIKFLEAGQALPLSQRRFLEMHENFGTQTRRKLLMPKCAMRPPSTDKVLT